MYSKTLLFRTVRRRHTIFRGRPAGWHVEMTRSAVTAGISAVVDYGLLIPLVELAGIRAVQASVVGVVAGQITSYLVHTLWIFPSGDHGYHGTQLVAFLSIGAIGLAVHTASMILFTDTLAFHYIPAKVISVLAMFSLGFLLRRYAHRNLVARGQ